jgi:hypothetical protein
MNASVPAKILTERIPHTATLTHTVDDEVNVYKFENFISNFKLPFSKR